MSGPPEKPKRRLFRLLRRGPRDIADVPRSVVEEGALWTAHQRAAESVRESAEAARRIVSHVAKQQGMVESLSDRARGVAARTTDLSSSFARLQDAFARLELVALNAGLEGARLGEGGGRALGLVSEEVRAEAQRGSESCRDLGLALGEVGSELVQVHTSLDRARDATSDVAQHAARAAGASAGAERALVEIGERLKKTTGSDPEIARSVAEATEHARALVAELVALRSKASPALVLSALRPVLSPLLRMLEGDEEAES
jgi:methyl-accepting chemotaxis protein